ncbi:hypothetical protein [Nocardia sp. R7R-8]|uniref:hypothetical protein n=1 Tax=Nocardia sp. R7R-8 TaxID=3459304 RepID=UPI00403E0751
MSLADRLGRSIVLVALPAVVAAAGVWWWRTEVTGVNPALALVDQVTIDGFTQLVSGVTFDDPPTAYAQYLGATDDHVLDRVHAPGVRLTVRADPVSDPKPDAIVIAVGDAPRDCQLVLERFLPTAAPFARHGVGPRQAAELQNGTLTKLQLKVYCPEP